MTTNFHSYICPLVVVDDWLFSYVWSEVLCVFGLRQCHSFEGIEPRVTDSRPTHHSPEMNKYAIIMQPLIFRLWL